MGQATRDKGPRLDAGSWRLSDGQARWESDLLSLSVDARSVGQGLQGVSFRREKLSDVQLLQLSVPGLEEPLGDQGLNELYVRGTDLVATYTKTAAGQFRPQIYWRGHRTGMAAGVEIILSMQTDQLHSDPGLVMTSQLPTGQLLQLDADDPARCRELSLGSDRWEEASASRGSWLLLFRFATCPVSYVEMVYPTDRGSFRLGQRPAEQGGWRCGHRLLQENLEKGVIRRARMAGWLLPREEDQPTAMALFHSFVRSPPPLTT